VLAFDNRLTILKPKPQFKGLGIATLFVQTAGVEKAPAYNKFLSLPSVMSTCSTTTVVDLVSSPQNNLPTDYQYVSTTPRV